MKKIIMYNHKTRVKISTTENFKSEWEKLGFVELYSIKLVELAS